MSGKKHHLKVCSTCRYWSYRYKGLCDRLNQGVGRFWGCEDWRAAAAKPEAGGQPAGGPPAAAS